ncbi:MAG: nucleoside triphosphate pyrophosphatase [Syntrophobacteraceae bacterium]
MTPVESDDRPLYRTLQPFVLASASPRRKELLHSVGLNFDVAVSGINEEAKAGEFPDEAARRWATEKARSVARMHENRWILAADTIVVLGGVIFGKPGGPKEAASMLKQLNGRSHDVITGMCLMHLRRGAVRLQSVRTAVQFRNVGSDEILAYVRTGEPLDKAGAYGVQGLGAFLVRSICGSYTNVVGLPLCETLEWLLKEGVIAPLGTESVLAET